MLNEKTIKKRILDVFRKKKVTSSTLMDALNISRSAAFNFTHTDSVSVHRLMVLSKALNYNFLNMLSNELDVESPSVKAPDGKDYTEKVKELEIENRVLRKLISEMTTKS